MDHLIFVHKALAMLHKLVQLKKICPFALFTFTPICQLKGVAISVIIRGQQCCVIV